MEQTSTEPTDVGVIVARFQVDELHEAHVDLIQYVSTRHVKVIIFLGLSPLKCTYNNPLDFEARKQMILEKFPNINVLYIKDMSSDTKWSNKLDEMISDVIGPNQTVSLYGGRSSFIEHYKGKHECIELKSQKSFISGTAIRKAISNKVKSSREFRAGVIWASMNQFVNAIPTVDIAIFNEGETELLLARKPFEDKFRFVGGHVDAGESFESAAKREVIEETGLEPINFVFIGSSVIDDWRHRSEKTYITTLLFKATRMFGKPEAKDDIEELKWFNISDIPVNKFGLLVKEHIPLAELLLDYLSRKSVNSNLP